MSAAEGLEEADKAVGCMAVATHMDNKVQDGFKLTRQEICLDDEVDQLSVKL